MWLLIITLRKFYYLRCLLMAVSRISNHQFYRLVKVPVCTSSPCEANTAQLLPVTGTSYRSLCRPRKYHYLVPVSKITLDLQNAELPVPVRFIYTRVCRYDNTSFTFDNETREWKSPTQSHGHAQGHCIRVFTECCLFIFPSISSNIKIVIAALIEC